MTQISVKQAAKLYRKTERTIYYWIAQDRIRSYDGLYDIDRLQAAYDKRHKPKPRISIWLDKNFRYYPYNWQGVCLG